MNTGVKKNLYTKSYDFILYDCIANSFKVRAKLYPLADTLGSYTCSKKPCEVRDVIFETSIFSSHATSRSFKVNHKFNCNDNYKPKKKKVDKI